MCSYKCFLKIGDKIKLCDDIVNLEPYKKGMGSFYAEPKKNDLLLVEKVYYKATETHLITMLGLLLENGRVFTNVPFPAELISMIKFDNSNNSLIFNKDEAKEFFTIDVENYNECNVYSATRDFFV